MKKTVNFPPVTDFKILIIFILLFSFSSNSYSQEDTKPLTLTTIEKLIKIPTPDSAISIDIQKFGVSFDITDEILENLEKIGAGSETIDSLRKIKLSQAKEKSQKPTSEEITILVANFNSEGESKVITESIIEHLRETLKNYSKIKVLVLNQQITAKEGRDEAIKIAKQKEVDMIIWGWYRKSKSTAIINAHIDIIAEIPERSSIKSTLTYVEDLSKLENFDLQLRLSKELSFLTTVALGLINYNLERFDKAIDFFTVALSENPYPNEVFPKSNLYLMRAKSNQGNTCFVPLGEETNIFNDVNESIKLGFNESHPEILSLLAFANLHQNPSEAINYAEKYYKNARNNKEKIAALFLLVGIYSQTDEERSKVFGERVLKEVLNLPEIKTNYLIYANAYLVSGDVAKGSYYLNKAFAEGIDDSLELFLAHLTLGLIHGGNLNYDLAINNFEKAVRAKSSCVVSYLFLANMYVLKKEPDKALSVINQAIELKPSMAKLYLARAEIYKEKGENQRAIANYEKAVELAPSSSEILRWLAYYYKERGENEKAIEIYTKYLSVNEKDAEIYEERAEVYAEMDNKQAAIADYKKALYLLAEDFSEKKESDFTILYLTILGKYLTSINYKDGIEISSKYIETLPNSARGYSTRAFFYKKLDELDLALKDLTNAIKLEPTEISNYEDRANIFIERREFDKALEDINQAIRLKPKKVELYEKRAEIFEKIGEKESSVKDYKKVLQLQAKETSTLSKLSLNSFYSSLIYKYKYNMSEDDSKYGIEITNEFISLFSSLAKGYIDRAFFFRQSGQTKLAIQDLDKAFELEPNNLKIYSEKAETYEKAGDIKSAIEEIQKAIEKANPDDKSSYEAKLFLLKLKLSERQNKNLNYKS